MVLVLGHEYSWSQTASKKHKRDENEAKKKVPKLWCDIDQVASEASAACYSRSATNILRKALLPSGLGPRPLNFKGARVSKTTRNQD
jgi:hypothetical protein